MLVFAHFPTKGTQKYTFDTQLQMFDWKNVWRGNV